MTKASNNFILILIIIFAPWAYVNAEVIDSVKIIIENALWQTKVTKYYDPSYVKMTYPNGDVPIDRGVCTDVIIRSFRAIGLDLQLLIHEDMEKNFGFYPNNWGLKNPDRNIDHRRVPNIACYLTKQNKAIVISKEGRDYKPGDIVTWKIPGNLDHIGLVSNIPVKNSDRYAIVHNIGNGAELEDVLFTYKITGHFRYFK